MLEKEFQYYIEHENELLSKYSGNYIIIVGNEIVGVYSDKKKAYFDSIKKYSLGTFFMKQCLPNTFVQTFQSQTSFK